MSRIERILEFRHLVCELEIEVKVANRDERGARDMQCCHALLKWGFFREKVLGQLERDAALSLLLF